MQSPTYCPALSILLLPCPNLGCKVHIFPVARCFIKVINNNQYPAKFTYLNIQPLESVSRYRDPQPQVVENYSYLINLTQNIYKSWCLNTHFIPNNGLNRLLVVISRQRQRSSRWEGVQDTVFCYSAITWLHVTWTQTETNVCWEATRPVPFYCLITWYYSTVQSQKQYLQISRYFGGDQ